MLSVSGLPDLAPPPGSHRRAKSDCGLNKHDKVKDMAPLALSPRSLSPSDITHARTRPSSPALVRSPSTSSIPEIFISGEDENSSAMSPVTRLAVFSLADFLETVAHHPQPRRHHLHHLHGRKKCSSSEVGAGSHGSGRRRSPLAARKSTPGGGAAGSGSGGEVNAGTPAGNNVGAGASGAGGSGGQATPHPARTGGSGGQAARLSNAATHFDESGVHSSTEDCDAETVPSSGVSNGSGELVDALRCVTDGGTGLLDDEEQLPHMQRTREAVEHIQSKIQKTKDLIKEEQKARDENVNEYLKLAANADRQQMARIKAVFEKKNQKSAALILQLQKKLENYQKRLREIEMHGVNAAHRQPKEVLRDMGQGLNHQQSTSGQGGAGGSSSGGGGPHGSKIGSEEGSECNSSITSESVPGGSNTLAHLASPRNHHGQLSGVDFFGQPGGMSMEQLLMELRESREEIARLREEIETTKVALAGELSAMREGLAEERFRCERLEEQVNDLTELHQNEMGNLVTNMADMEEKVQYQSEERIRDLHEIVENCHTRISRMEHQQAQQQQQYLTLEGLEDSNARAVFVKLINVLLTVLQVLLLVVATVANILTPLLQTRSRLIGTATAILFVLFVYIQLPELKELWLAAADRFRQLVPFK